MGANMARHLNDRGWDVTAVYDIDRAAAAELAAEIGAINAETLASVTAASVGSSRSRLSSSRVRQAAMRLASKDSSWARTPRRRR